MLTLLTLALAPQVAAPAAGGFPATPTRRPRTDRPNIVFILADDFGVNMVSGYGEVPDPPCTPNIDNLASDGLLFRNAWANPSCTPTRGALMSGRYGFRTGLGSPGGLLELSEVTLPETLNGYYSAALGKWHLAGPGGSTNHPNDSGFDHYAGSLGGGIGNYFSWSKTTNGSQAQTTVYGTEDLTNDAIEMVQTMPAPWFLYMSYNAPHTPFHVPPSSICQAAQCGTTFCGNLGPNPSSPDLAKAMTEAMDAEIGRFLSALDVVDPSAIVIFMGDNGTARAATEAPFVMNRAKGSPYEGGVNVPLIVRGPRVARGETQALVAPVDIYATIAELAGGEALTEDSVSFVPTLRNPATSPRQLAYAEGFSPNGAGPYAEHNRSVREDRYKLIRQLGEPDELYDLQLDPFEQTNRLDLGLTPVEQAAYDTLLAELVRLGVD